MNTRQYTQNSKVFHFEGWATGRPLWSVFPPVPGIESSRFAFATTESARPSTTVWYGVEEEFVKRVSIVSRA